jgi:general secretion pathway protein D
MTASEAYRMFLSSLDSMGLTVQPQGKVLKVIESNRARETAIPLYVDDHTPPAQDGYVTRMRRLEQADVNDVKQVLDRLRSKDGDISVHPPTNTLIITDLSTNIRRMEEVIAQLDVPMGGEKVYLIKLQSVASSEMAALLQAVFNAPRSGPVAPPQPPATRGPSAAANPIVEKRTQN